VKTSKNKRTDVLASSSVVHLHSLLEERRKELARATVSTLYNPVTDF
jgi:hypothetical protein